MDKRRTEGRTVVDNGEIVTDEGRLARNVDLQSQTPVRNPNYRQFLQGGAVACKELRQVIE
jgi:hypothetical protein